MAVFCALFPFADHPFHFLQHQSALPPELALPIATRRPRLRKRALETLALGELLLPLGLPPLDLLRPRLGLCLLPLSFLYSFVEVARLALFLFASARWSVAVSWSSRAGRCGFRVRVLFFVIFEHGLSLGMNLRRWWLVGVIVVVVFGMFSLYPALVVIPRMVLFFCRFVF